MPISFQDTFSRVDALGWGPSYTNVQTWPSGRVLSVNGSYGTLEASGSDYSEGYVEWANQAGMALSPDGQISFDFWIPANTSDNKPYADLYQGGEYPVTLYIGHQSGTTWEAYFDYRYSSTAADFLFTPQPSSWYRIKAAWAGRAGGDLLVKVWKVGDAEPDWQASGSMSLSATPLTDPNDWFSVSMDFESPTAEPLGIDNITFEAIYLPGRSDLTANAIIRRPGMLGSPYTLDALVAARHFGMDAWIIGGRARHSRFLDHFGTEPDTVVVLDGSIGNYPSGMEVHLVLDDLIRRVAALEGGNHRMNSFTAGAFIQPYLTASAIIARYGYTLSTTLDAAIVGGKTNQLVTMDAFIRRSTSGSFTAGAYLIDLVC